MKHLKHIVTAELDRRSPQQDPFLSEDSVVFPRILPGKDLKRRRAEMDEPVSPTVTHRGVQVKGSPPNFCPDMIRRVDIAPRPADPMGRPESRDHDTATNTHLLEGGRGPATGHEFTHMSSASTRRDGYFGGFPGPYELFARVISRLFPQFHQSVQQRLTIPRTKMLVPYTAGDSPPGSGQRVSYISFNVIVDRNSVFKNLTEENIQELGGVEYRALNALLWIIPLVSYFLSCRASLQKTHFSRSTTSDYYWSLSL